MSLNDTPSSSRIHIGFFGKRNAGKSSLVNAVTNQELSIVSDVKGTTTDPVYKSMEILPLGPVVIIDTPGYDDEGTLGEQRVKKTKQILNKTDIAVLVADAAQGPSIKDKELIDLFEKKNINYVVVYNKCDIVCPEIKLNKHEMYVSAVNKQGINELRELLGRLAPKNENTLRFIGDFIESGDIVVFVTPIDESAPKGRLILPQQQAVRDVLDANAISVVVQVPELKAALASLGRKPKLVVTDSQAFAKVSEDTPKDILLTSFSILMARYKGLLKSAVSGAAYLDKLTDGDTVLISEGCTHHRQCNDIGTVKLPKWLEAYTGKKLNYEFSSGTGFPENLKKYALIIHCGGCMLNDREVMYRVKCAAEQNVPITNYGTAIAQMNGILKRSLEVLPDYLKLLD